MDTAERRTQSEKIILRFFDENVIAEMRAYVTEMAATRDADDRMNNFLGLTGYHGESEYHYIRAIRLVFDNIKSYFNSDRCVTLEFSQQELFRDMWGVMDKQIGMMWSKIEEIRMLNPVKDSGILYLIVPYTKPSRK